MSAGAAPSSWQTYCWLDLDGYNDATARSASGQSFSISLPDGSTLSFTLHTTSTAATGAVDVAAPSWTGAAMVGYSAQTGGVAPYNHTLTGSFDSAVSGILVTPEGVLDASNGTDHPSFTIRYRVRIE